MEGVYERNLNPIISIDKPQNSDRINSVKVRSLSRKDRISDLAVFNLSLFAPLGIPGF
jgi:hypothetical protein